MVKDAMGFKCTQPKEQRGEFAVCTPTKSSLKTKEEKSCQKDNAGIPKHIICLIFPLLTSRHGCHATAL